MNRHAYVATGPNLASAPFCTYREAVEGAGIRTCMRPQLDGIHIGSARPDLCQWCWAVEGMTQQCTCTADCGRPKCPKAEVEFDWRSVPVPIFKLPEPAPETEETDHAA